MKTPLHFPALEQLSAAQCAAFRECGFVAVEKVISSNQVLALRERFEPLLSGEFETGVYPDEWYWREGMSLPEAARHMSNLWKCDLTVARLALSPSIARAAATLAEWPAARLGQDTLWMKLPGTKPIALHQDTSFMDFLVLPRTITAWVALDDTKAGAGTIAYVPGSQHWPIEPLPKDFHVAGDHWQARMRAAAALAGIKYPMVRELEVPAGSIVFHDGGVWQGSGPNNSPKIIRRSLGIHFLHPESRFGPDGGGYIYGRYQRVGDDTLDESFPPVTWSNDGYRTGFIADYCEAGRKH